MFFTVNNKTGFKCFEPLVIIKDANGLLFYYKKNTKGVQKFNLPKGLYETENMLTVLPQPLNYKLPKLSRPYAKTALPKNGFNVIYTDNPNKCSVDLSTHTIYFDNEFRDAPKIITDYIMGHELGHYLYKGKGQKSEIECDNFSTMLMLKKGYNPSQINAVIQSTLGDKRKALSRKKKNYNFLLYTNGN